MSKTPKDVVREIFPDATEEQIEMYVWTYTGFPFGAGRKRGESAESALIRQLTEARDVMAEGKTFELDSGWMSKAERFELDWAKRCLLDKIDSWLIIPSKYARSIKELKGIEKKIDKLIRWIKK